MAFTSATPIQIILLDIEGTTTPVDFVYQTLFPYARLRLREFLAQNIASEDVLSDIALLRAERATDVLKGADVPNWQEDSLAASAAAYAEWLMEQDRKSTALKSLQGKIWKDGYLTGQLRGEVYEDVPLAMRRWRAQQKEIAIFSSGSVLAQQLLFAHSTAGDLTGLISGYFDTTTGPKREAESYQKIAAAMNVPATQVLFLSDVPAELDAAEQAGMKTALSARPGNQPVESAHPVVYTFDEIFA